MEKGLRDCCRSIRIGKILIQSNEDTHEAKVSKHRKTDTRTPLSRSLDSAVAVNVSEWEDSVGSIFIGWFSLSFLKIYGKRGSQYLRERHDRCVTSVFREFQVVYAKFPEDVASRRVLLMYPIMSTGNTIIKATKVLLEHGVKASNIILLNLFCTPKGTFLFSDELSLLMDFLVRGCLRQCLRNSLSTLKGSLSVGRTMNNRLAQSKEGELDGESKLNFRFQPSNA